MDSARIDPYYDGQLPLLFVEKLKKPLIIIAPGLRGSVKTVIIFIKSDNEEIRKRCFCMPTHRISQSAVKINSTMGCFVAQS